MVIEKCVAQKIDRSGSSGYDPIQNIFARVHVNEVLIIRVFSQYVQRTTHDQEPKQSLDVGCLFYGLRGYGITPA